MTLVSAILPTRGRQQWAANALQCFLAQSYEPKNLFIVDDADEPSFPNGTEHPQVTYVLLPERRSIGAKRNVAAKLANGEILIHVDSDDWSALNRIETQVAELEASGKQVHGFNAMLFHDVTSGKSYKYQGHRNYALGTSLCYFRSFWERNPFQEANLIGEDNVFVGRAKDAGQLVSMDAGELMVARIHAGNTSLKHPTGMQFRATDHLPAGFLA